MKKLEEYRNGISKYVIQSMRDYLNFDEEYIEGDSIGYTLKDIEKCGAILNEYIDDLSESNKDEKLILKSVKKVVLALNKLNQNCEYELIETDQREDLSQFINETAIVAGLSEFENDITEEWREW